MGIRAGLSRWIEGKSVITGSRIHDGISSAIMIYATLLGICCEHTGESDTGQLTAIWTRQRTNGSCGIVPEGRGAGLLNGHCSATDVEAFATLGIGDQVIVGHSMAHIFRLLLGHQKRTEEDTQKENWKNCFAFKSFVMLKCSL